ncbi:hypothetical protein FN846DRAFT_906091 [Sphaerosporella brunnea]|uniref:Uncharacterized protein n=1 Tax=Sphaerosporella brunnea TaxID=1250544 RepID=A0A5J5EZB2_9PEZI|nr:hypothetical protein FN846DRAFT_906091 [Sphaerosporella brunnea]
MRLTAFLSLTFAAAASAADGVLYPINPLTLEAVLSGKSVSRRSTSEQFAALAPSTQAQLAYGTPGANGQLLLANITLTAPDGMLVVMMERLEGLTTAVDCSTVGDGALGVTWKDKETYQEALNSWSWVNENSTNQFLVVVNHEGCGEDAQRAAYRVTDVNTDEASLMTKLTAVAAPWQNITGTFEMDFGKVVLRPAAAARLRDRGWSDFWNSIKDGVEKAVDTVVDGAKEAVDKAKDAAKDAVDAVKDAAGTVVDDVKDKAGEALDEAAKIGKEIEAIFNNGGGGELSEAIEFDVSGGEQGVVKNIFTDPFSPPRLVVDCTNCFIAGKFQLQGSIRVSNFQVEDLTLSISPSNFSATAEIQTTLSAEFSPDELNGLTTTGASKNLDLLSLDGTTNLIEIPVPGAGIVIPQIFSLGLIASVEAGVTIGFKGDLSFKVGLAVSLPDSAELSLDLTDLSTSTATGFDGAKAEPILELNNSSASAKATLFFRPKFAVKAEVASVGELSADISVGLPQINANVALEYNENGGVCTGSTEKTGVKFSLGGVLNVVAGITGTIAGQGGRLLQKTLASLDLFTPLEKCVPFRVPGVSAASVSASATPASVSTGFPVPTANSSYFAGTPAPIRARRLPPRGSSQIWRPVNIQW